MQLNLKSQLAAYVYFLPTNQDQSSIFLQQILNANLV